MIINKKINKIMRNISNEELTQAIQTINALFGKVMVKDLAAYLHVTRKDIEMHLPEIIQIMDKLKID